MDIDVEMYDPEHLCRAGHFTEALHLLEAAHRVNIYARDDEPLHLEFIDGNHEPYGPDFIIGDQAEDSFERKLGIDESFEE